MRPRVVLTRRVPDPVRFELERSFDLVARDEHEPPPRGDLLAAVPGAAGLVTTLTETVDAELLDAAGPELRVVANYAVGTDNVDLGAAARRGVVVANTPDVLTDATAELALGLMLALARRIAEGDRLVRSRVPWVWAPTFMLGRGLQGLTLGIVGLGRIGRAVARLAGAHGMEVVYTSRTPRKEVGLERLELDELLARAHVVSLHAPLTAETFHCMATREFRLMRSDAFLVNTARGPLVDEAELVEALRAGEIAGAALDVFEDEPRVHGGLLELSNVVLAPHLGSATEDVRVAMGMLCVDALRAVLLEDRRPGNAVSLSSGEG